MYVTDLYIKTTATVTMKANKSYKLVVHKRGFGGSGENVLNTSLVLVYDGGSFNILVFLHR